MRTFDDYTRHEVKGAGKKEHIDSILEYINNLHSNGKIKDIMIIARTADTEPTSKYGLPQNIVNALTVDSEYEATVFMRFATDILFDRMKHVAIRDYLRKVISSESEEK